MHWQRVSLPAPRIDSGTMPEYEPSAALSMTSYPGSTGIATRKVAILACDGVDIAVLGKICDVLLEHGAVPRVVAPKLGAIKGNTSATWQADVTIDAAPSALYDAMIVPPGDASTTMLCEHGLAVEFIKDQYRHCKPILVFDTGADLLDRAELPAVLPTGDADFSLINVATGQLEEALAQFIQALAGPRELGRETDPPVV